MKPVGIFRHARSEGPGYFATYLERRSLPWKLIALDAGEALPRAAREFSGLVLMGGPMSVNDELAWIRPLLELVRDAVRNDLPVLGHCLGGQLIARAFGGVVGANPVTEIGWGEVRIADSALARAWFGDAEVFNAFHWHSETFSIPPGATRIASSACCVNQAFVLGKHVGLQCHVEMTSGMIHAWCVLGREEIEAADSPAVQKPEQMEEDIEARVTQLNQIANRLYDKWTEGLAKD